MSEEIKHGEVPKSEAETGDAGGDTVTIESEQADAIVAKTVNIQQSGVKSVQAETVDIQQGGAESVKAETVHLEQGGIISAEANTIELTQGGIMLARGKAVTLHDGGAGAVFAEHAELQNASVVLLAAQEVSGEARILLDLKAAVILGLVTGLVVGLFKLFARQEER